MGNYAIIIEGVGVHHNMGLDADANVVASKVVDQLKGLGHTITKAVFKTGSRDAHTEEDVSGGDGYRAAFAPPAPTELAPEPAPAPEPPVEAASTVQASVTPTGGELGGLP